MATPKIDEDPDKNVAELLEQMVEFYAGSDGHVHAPRGFDPAPMLEELCAGRRWPS